MQTVQRLTAMNDGRERLKFPIFATLHSNLLAMIIIMNVRFTDISRRYHAS